MTTDLVDALLTLHHQPRLAATLAATAAIGSLLGAPWHVACLLRDAGTGAWYATAIVDGGGRSAPLEQVGLPAGPFVFVPPAEPGPWTVTAVLGGVWGNTACTTVTANLHAAGVLYAAIPGPDGPRGALLAFVPAVDQAAVLAGVLRHGAATAARNLDREQTPFVDGVLDPRALADQAVKEIARANRYRRELAVVLFEAGSVVELARFGPALVRSLRRWDLVGRPDADRPALVAVLPETGRGGGRGLMRRLGDRVAGIGAGIATFPDDGASLARLMEIAHARIASTDPQRGVFSTPPAPAVSR